MTMKREAFDSRALLLNHLYDRILSDNIHMVIHTGNNVDMVKTSIFSQSDIFSIVARSVCKSQGGWNSGRKTSRSGPCRISPRFQ